MTRAIDKRRMYSATAALAVLAGLCATAVPSASALPGVILDPLLGNLLGPGAELKEPADVAVMPDGSVVIADTKNHRIRRIAPDGTATTVAGSGTAGYSDTAGALATFNQPTAVEPLPDGALLVADRVNNRVRRVSALGMVTTVAGNGNGGDYDDDDPADDDFPGEGGQATAASLDRPEDVSATADGGYLIADTGNDAIRKVDAAGVIRTVAGGGSNEGDGGPATSAELDDPRGVEALPNGGFLVSEAGGDRIRRVDPAGRISTVAGNGSNGFAGDGGPATSARIDEPADVAALPDGGFLFADRKNDRVRLVSPEGIISSFAVGLNRPLGVAVSPKGVVYVADTLNNVIKVFGAEVLEAADKADDGKGQDLDADDGGKLAAPAPPVVGKRFNLTLVRGTVTIRKRGAKRFTTLAGSASVPVGSVVNTTAGAARLVSAAGSSGKRQSAVFHSGSFLVSQRRARRPVTELSLRGGDLSACPGGSKAVTSARAARRGLWGRGHGRFRTRGRHGAATVRGTIWYTADTCSGTRVRVRRGVVSVRDFARRRTVRVGAGHSYLARSDRARDRGRR